VVRTKTKNGDRKRAPTRSTTANASSRLPSWLSPGPARTSASTMSPDNPVLNLELSIALSNAGALLEPSIGAK